MRVTAFRSSCSFWLRVRRSKALVRGARRMTGCECVRCCLSSRRCAPTQRISAIIQGMCRQLAVCSGWCRCREWQFGWHKHPAHNTSPHRYIHQPIHTLLTCSVHVYAITKKCTRIHYNILVLRVRAPAGRGPTGCLTDGQLVVEVEAVVGCRLVLDGPTPRS